MHFIGTPCNLRRETCLFDVANDPCEKNNLAKSHPDILKMMLDSMEKYKPVPPLFPPLTSEADPWHWNGTWTNWLDYTT